MRATTTALLATSAALASAQRGNWGPGGDNDGHNGWNNYGPFAGNSCLNSCTSSIDSSCNAGHMACYCNNNIGDMNDCIESSDCSDSEKSDTYQAIAQVCANAGATTTAAPQASFSATSGASNPSTSWEGGWRGGWRYGQGRGDAQSQTDVRSLTNEWATASSVWASWASEKGMPTDTAAWDGTAYPTASWASQLSSWATETRSGDGWGPGGAYGPGGSGGWNPGNGYGPFGQNGAGNGWGPWASRSGESWTAGPWTSWWGGNGNGDGCPGSTWSGWTNGPWSTNAPWTTWSGCQASTTATSTVTNTVTNSAGEAEVTTSLDFGVQVAAASQDGELVSGSGSDSAAMGVRGKSVEAGMTALVAGVLAVAVGVGAVAL